MNTKNEHSNIPPDLLGSVTDMMQGDQEAALLWLRTPLEILGNTTPLSYISEQDDGLNQVYELIGRIRHGVIS